MHRRLSRSGPRSSPPRSAARRCRATASSPTAPTSSCSATSRAQLGEVAEQVGGRAKGVISILGATPLQRRQGRLPGRPRRADAAEHAGRGAARASSCHARDPEADPDFEHACHGALRPRRPRRHRRRALIDAAMGLMSCAPAYYGARRRGPDRRRRAPRAPGRRRRRDGRAGRWPAPPRCCSAATRHARRAPRGHLARRLDRPGPRRARSATTCAPRSTTRSTPCWTVAGDRPRHASASDDRRLLSRAASSSTRSSSSSTSS